MIVYGERGTLLVHQPRPTRGGERAGAGRVQVVTPEGSRFVDPPALPPDERDGPASGVAAFRRVLRTALSGFFGAGV